MKYRDKREAAQAMVREMFSAIPQRMITRNDNFYDEWDLTARLDEEEAEDFYDEWDLITARLDEEEAEEQGEEYGYADVPMWGWVWLADDSYMERFIDGHRNEIMDLGFTILENYAEGWLCLGIDGAGFDFYEAFWIPLYDLMGFKWHD